MSEFDFGDLAVKADETVELPLYQLARNGQHPVLLVRAATEENAAFFNGIVRLDKSRERQRHGGTATIEMIRKRREDDAVLFAKHVIKGWRGVTDKTGTAVAFTVEECVRWLHAVLRAAPDVYLEILAFCQDRANFRAGAMDVEEAAKNS